MKTKYTIENQLLALEIDYLKLCVDTMYGPDFEGTDVFNDEMQEAYAEMARRYNSAKIIVDEAAREQWGYGPEYQTYENLDPVVKTAIEEADNVLLKLLRRSYLQDVYGEPVVRTLDNKVAFC